MRVSIVICTWNHSDIIEPCIKSVLNSTYRDFEFLIVDQSTNEKTKELVEKYIARDPRIRYFPMKTKGLTKGFNFAIKNSSGDIIAIIGDDCAVARDWIEKILFVFNRHPDIDIVYGSVIPEVDSEKKWFVPGVILKDRLFSGPRSKIFENGIGANMIIRKRLFEKIGYFDETMGPGSSLPAGEELDFSYRALKKGFKVVHSSLVKVKHYGKRKFDEFYETLKKNRINDAVVFSKHIRCYDLNAVYVLIGLYIRNIFLIIQTTLLDHLQFIQRVTYKFYLMLALSLCFLKGIVMSTKYAVDKRHLIFISKDKLCKD